VPLALDRPAGRSDDAEVTLVELLVDAREGEPSVALEHRELMGYLHDAVDLLSDRHRFVILGAFFEERTAGDLARIAYGSSKGAIITMTKYIATQHGRQNIRCNSVAPGVVLTEALDKTVPGLKEIIKRHVLTPEFGTPDDIAALVAFLASDESRYITGENISISGGGLSHQPHYADLLDLMEQHL
jgi:NAD(P)-dependent dehydrogenase (short-subunit alcohol dehydrogenase family)